MPIITTGISLIAMMVQIDCPDVPYSEDVPSSEAEIAELNSMAKEVAPAHLKDEDFDSVEVSKCRKQTFDQPSNTTATMEVLRFEGLFLNTSNVSDVSTRERIECRIVRTIGDSGLTRADRFCSRYTQQLLSYPGITSPIEISYGLTIDEARLVLSFFSGHVGKNIETLAFTQEEFSSIHRMSALGRPDNTRRFYATVQSGCVSKSVWVSGSGSSPISFEKTGRSGAIC
jgi:hypothetical protein